MAATDTALKPAIYAATAAAHPGLPTLHGVPWPQGDLQPDGAVAVRTPAGDLRPASMQPLVSWPDGSVRWGLIVFNATEVGCHVVESVGADAPANAVATTVADDSVVLDNGLVRVELANTGPGPIRKLTAAHHDYLTAPEQFRLAVDDASTLNESERAIKVLTASPLRTRVRIEGAHYKTDGSRCLNYRLDVELWAGWPTLRLDYQFMNLEAGHKSVDVERIGIDWDWQLGDTTERHFKQWVWGLFFVPREVRNPQRVALVSDDSRSGVHIESPEMLLDTFDYPDYLRAPLVETDDWLGITDGSRSIYARQEDLGPMRPSRLASDGAGMSLDAWPPTAGILALPQGRTRRPVITLSFADSADCQIDWIKETLGAPVTIGRSYVAPEWVRACGEFDQDRMMQPGAHSRFEKYLHRLMQLDMPETMFDLGDTPGAGYQSTYIGAGQVKRRAEAPHLKTYFSTNLVVETRQAFVPDWAHPEFFELVWENNEYDVIFAFASEIMRRGRYDLWQTVARLARHNIEVDFLHLHDEERLHRSTPAHSADHTTTGSYPSHFWTQGLLAYYCMSGDIDALEVACGLGDKIIETFQNEELRSSVIGFNREIGWPVLALSYLDTYSGEDRFRAQLDDLLSYLVAFDRGNPPGSVNLSGVDPYHPFTRQLLGAFFGYASMVEGIDHYIRRTGDEKVRAWLVTFISELRDALKHVHNKGESMPFTQMQTLGMAIGYELTGDRSFLETGIVTLQELMDSTSWHTPPRECKLVTMTWRGLPRFLHHAVENDLIGHLDVRC